MNRVRDDAARNTLLAAIQRFRGSVYLEDGAIAVSELTPDGRHVDWADDLSWHVALFDDGGEVCGCIRIGLIGREPAFPLFHQADLIRRMSAPAREEYGGAFQGVIQAGCGDRAGFGDTGAWAVSSRVAKKGLGIFLICVGWTLYRILGDAIVMAMATHRHGAAQLLRHLGATPLAKQGASALPPFFDSHYGCDMSLLVFDTRCPTPEVEEAIGMLRDEVVAAKVHVPQAQNYKQRKMRAWKQRIIEGGGGGSNLIGWGGCRLVLAVPEEGIVPASMGGVIRDPESHARIVSGVQRLRARVYLADGAVKEAELDAEGRHVDPHDETAWHVVLLDEADAVCACVRLAHYPGGAPYEAFRERELIGRMPEGERGRYEAAVRRLLTQAGEERVPVADCGAWAVAPEVSHKGHGIFVAVAVWALCRELGDALTLAMATRRHRSADLLKKMGAYALGGAEPLPPVEDAHYGCAMELLAFDSRRPAPETGERVEDLRGRWSGVKVVSR